MLEGSAVDSLGHWEMSSAHRDWPMFQIQEYGGHRKREGVWMETMVIVVIGDAAAHYHTCSVFPHPTHSY